MLISKLVYQISDEDESAAKIRPGETISLQLQNAFGKSFENEEDFEGFLNDKELKKRFNHPCTGPVEIITSSKDISLAVHVLDIKATCGYQCISQSTGFLKERFKDRSCKIIPIPDSQHIQFQGEDLLIKTAPKIGFMATIDGQKRSVGRTSENGGNIDLNFLSKGSTIYLPVNCERARLLVGDLHICQGNGEVAGIAIEADGVATLKVDVVDKIPFPLIEDKTRIIVVGWGPTVDACLKKSVENSMEYFGRVFPFCDWPESEIYKLISGEGNLMLGNSTGNVATCGMVFYKERMLNKHHFKVFA